MKKRVTEAFGKKVYLLGKDAEGTLYWLEEASWDCDWYWGLGYIETYTNNRNPHLSKDINSHEYWEDKVKLGYKFEWLTETTFSKEEAWELADLMKCAYNCRHYSDMMHVNSANITEKNFVLKQFAKWNEAEYWRINHELIPELMKRVYDILTPDEEKYENIDLNMKWKNYPHDTIYLWNGKDIFRISEGDGCNLDEEDRKEGYKDNWVTNFIPSDGKMDGGMWLETDYIVDIDYTIQGVIDRMCECDLWEDNWKILKDEYGERLWDRMEMERS